MTWDDTKVTSNLLTAAEWNAMVTDQKSRVSDTGDTMTGALIIDPSTDVSALKIVPQNDTAGKFAIQIRNAADDADVTTIDNAGKITTTTFVGALTGAASSNVLKAGDTMTSTLVIDPATDVTALKIVPQNDTGGKYQIYCRNAADGATVFSVENEGTTTAGKVIVDDITIDGSTISSAVNNLAITPVAGKTISLDGTISIDAGEVIGITSLGVTGTRVTAGFFTDLTVSNAIAGSTTGNLLSTGGNLTGNLTLDSGKTVDGVDISTWRNGVSGVAALNATRELPHHINKAASANVRNTHNAEATTQSGAYAKLKTITLTNGLVGQQRFLFDLKSGDGKATAYGRIYRNGVALGSEQTDVTGGYVTKSEDLTQTWAPGDTAELWSYISDVAQIAYVQNFQIAYDDSPTVVVASANS